MGQFGFLLEVVVSGSPSSGWGSLKLDDARRTGLLKAMQQLENSSSHTEGIIEQILERKG